MNIEDGTRIVQIISEKEIRVRVRQLAGRISRDYRGKEPVLLCVLTGAWIFAADLARFLAVPAVFEFVWPSSYGSDTKTSGKVKIGTDGKTCFKNKDVIIIEDILDTGLTLSAVKEKVENSGARSIKMCCLLSKKVKRRREISLDYKGFEIENKFVVGYGLDYAGRYRFLPFIGYLSRE